MKSSLCNNNAELVAVKEQSISCALIHYIFSPDQSIYFFCFVPLSAGLLHLILPISLVLTVNTTLSFSGSRERLSKEKALHLTLPFFNLCQSWSHPKTTWLNSGINGKTWKSQRERCRHTLTQPLHIHFTFSHEVLLSENFFFFFTNNKCISFSCLF